MTIVRRRLLAAILILLASLSIAAGPAMAMTSTERGRALAKLKWINGPASLPIGAPAASFDLAPGMMAVTGPDAHRAWEILQTGTAPELQAIVLVPDLQTVVFIMYAEPGHVRMDDWSTFSPDNFMTNALEKNRQLTPIREAAGLPAMLDAHWEIKPQINQDQAVIHWGLSYFDPQKNTRALNIAAIRLGRLGYVRLAIALSMDNYDKHPEAIELLEKNFRFQPGAGYADFAQGDKEAPFGIAGLAMRPAYGE